MTEHEVCILCKALAWPEEQPIHNRVLFETKRFSVIPAIGALASGHVLVVTKAHIPSFAALSAEGLSEYRIVLDKICQTYHLLSTDILEAEHGGTALHSGGGCIRHAHTSIMPGLGPFVDIFEGILDPIEMLADMKQLAKVPYILLRRGNIVRAYQAYNVPSQCIRRRICEVQRREDWDWCVFPNREETMNTIRLWYSQQ